MADLAGARVGLLEGRMGSELAGLIRRHGGEPRLAPALREEPVGAALPVGALIDALGRGAVQVVVFLTGVGATALFREAEQLGRLAELVTALRHTTNVCRGHKPWQPLKRHGVPITVTVAEPYTTADVVRTLEAIPVEDRGVALLHYGERSSVLTEALRRRGARVNDLCLYQWRLPADTEPLRALVREVIAGELDAVVFTSQVQVRHLLQVADQEGRADELLQSLRQRTVVAAVGPTCAAALEAAGVPPRVVPANPKMGPMVVALAEHLACAVRNQARAGGRGG